ncbi:hypothetical protein NQ317_008407 [Molorchus minor]|uniref:28S ribosomal protein S24, mitochondrial n=1 Tax=Molorchus minor TaxID=1323400 RepID=A0ABQ9K6Y3_9CUCU|nr:hypothetical protein NQ317_008407 [Molorchus minor]
MLNANLICKTTVLGNLKRELVNPDGFTQHQHVSNPKLDGTGPPQRKDFPLTYEMANPPHQIAHRKTWNSWNTTNLQGGLRPSETAVEDQFIRKFMVGTWHRLLRYTEELLSFWLQCPVKLELQSVANKKDVIFKYI